MKLNSFIFIIMALLIIMAGIVNAEPFAEASELDLKVYCNQINCSGAPQCNFTVSNPNSTVFLDQVTATYNTAFYSYNFTIPEVSGSYDYNLYCSPLNSFSSSFEVTPNGELATTGKAFFYIGLLGLLVFFLTLMFWAHMQDQSFLAKFWWFSFMWIPIWAILFIGWNMARDFLSSSGAIQSVLYICWLVVGITYPFFLLGLVLYTFYWIYEQRQVQKLIDRGFSEDDAKNRVSGRSRGMGMNYG